MHFSKQDVGNSEFPTKERIINLAMAEFPKDVFSRLILGAFCLQTLCFPTVYFSCVLIYLMDLDQTCIGLFFLDIFQAGMRLHSLLFGSQKSNLAAIQSKISVFNSIESQRVLCVPAIMQLQISQFLFSVGLKVSFTGQIQRC